MSLVGDERIKELLMKEAFLEKLLPRLREETIEECALVALREDIPLGRLEIYNAIRALNKP